MDLENIIERGVESKKGLEVALDKKHILEEERKRVAEILKKVQEKEVPLVQYAHALLKLAQNRVSPPDYRGSFGAASPDSARTSSLVVVGKEGKGTHYLVGVKQNYVPKDYDGDGNPRGEEFAGWSFVASVGVKMTEFEYSSLSGEERDTLAFLGETISGERMYGSSISEEGFGRSTPTFLEAEQAQVYAEVTESRLGEVAQTVDLLKQSLGNEKLNPRNGLAIPEYFL